MPPESSTDAVKVTTGIGFTPKPCANQNSLGQEDGCCISHLGATSPKCLNERINVSSLSIIGASSAPVTRPAPPSCRTKLEWSGKSNTLFYTAAATTTGHKRLGIACAVDAPPQTSQLSPKRQKCGHCLFVFVLCGDRRLISFHLISERAAPLATT